MLPGKNMISSLSAKDGRKVMNTINNRGPNVVLWDTPWVTSAGSDYIVDCIGYFCI